MTDELDQRLPNLSLYFYPCLFSAVDPLPLSPLLLLFLCLSDILMLMMM